MQLRTLQCILANHWQALLLSLLGVIELKLSYREFHQRLNALFQYPAGNHQNHKKKKQKKQQPLLRHALGVRLSCST